MLKGVSQKVIEVVHTDNRYFEKAILFIRVPAQSEDKTLLKERAGEYLSQINYHPSDPKHRFRLNDGIKFLLAALGGAGIACLFFLL
ncbi:MAG: hypothetical protein E7476_15920 [Ruminococcaceae bacterium]|nr:hypothetical protein [Oscillospiraceae bacterium]